MMRRFKFALKPVLDHRERIEDEKQQALALRMQELQKAQGELARLDAEFRRFSVRLRSEHRTLALRDLRTHYAHLEYLDRRITAQHLVIAQCRKAVDRAREEVLAASKDRKVIERLKDKRFEEHRASEAYLEQRELDDANARHYGRARLSGGAS